MDRQRLSILLGWILLLSILYAPPGNADLNSDREALLKLRSSLRGRPLLWNLTASICSWHGVICNQDRVIELRLPGMGLSGRLPSNVIGSLTNLETLSLRFNSLTGTIPPDLASLASLQNLYLQGNRLSGNIPPFLFSMQSLVRLNLASNNLDGNISSAFNNLTRLKTLYLEKNRLVGSIPNLTIPLVQFNVSYNQLSGEIPVGLSRMPGSAFQGNSLCGKPLDPCDVTTKGSSKLSGAAIAGIVIGCVLGFLIILSILAVLSYRRMTSYSPVNVRSTKSVANVQATGERSSSAEGSTEHSASTVRNFAFFGKEEKTFALEDLLAAPAEVLGKGTFGTTYKAEFVTGMVVAVKRLRDVKVSASAFQERVEELGSMDHENLVPLRACYFNRDENLLVNDHIASGSLSAILHGDKGDHRTPLGWDTRHQIALGVARGIAYIHSRGPDMCHGNIKSSNILLTETYEARVSDYGLALLAGPKSRVHGCLPPEATDARAARASQKADVYCFGVLVLELLTGKAPSTVRWKDEESGGGGLDLPRWVHSVVSQEWIAEVFDPELLRYEDVEEDMVQLLKVAMDCTTLDPDKRPSMAEVKNRVGAISPPIYGTWN